MHFLSYETELQTFAKMTATKTIFFEGYQPERGEIVLVKNLYKDKWVRCKVEDIVVFISGDPEYTVWLIDYGYILGLDLWQWILYKLMLYSHPLQTQSRYILPLHKSLAQVEIPLIYKAGLANIVPATKVNRFAKFFVCL